MISLMKVDGIDPVNTIPGHEGYIKVESFRFGIGRGISMSANDPNREPTGPSFAEVSITRLSDEMTPVLGKQMVLNEPKEYNFKFIESNKLEETKGVLELKVSDALLSSFSLDSSESGLQEHFSISYTKISIISPEAKKLMGYDLMKRQVLKEAL